jgi:hypothetical protein
MQRSPGNIAAALGYGPAHRDYRAYVYGRSIIDLSVPAPRRVDCPPSCVRSWFRHLQAFEMAAAGERGRTQKGQKRGEGVEVHVNNNGG